MGIRLCSESTQTLCFDIDNDENGDSRKREDIDAGHAKGRHKKSYARQVRRTLSFSSWLSQMQKARTTWLCRITLCVWMFRTRAESVKDMHARNVARSCPPSLSRARKSKTMFLRFRRLQFTVAGCRRVAGTIRGNWHRERAKEGGWLGGGSTEKCQNHNWSTILAAAIESIEPIAAPGQLRKEQLCGFGSDFLS